MNRATKLALLIVGLIIGLSTVTGCLNSGHRPSGLNSGVQGQAVLDSPCPPTRSPSLCPDRPIQAKVAVTQKTTNNEVATLQTDIDGRFKIPLAPGSYVLHATNVSHQILPRGEDVDITVEPDQFLEVTLRFDAGIRDAETP